MAAQKRVRGTAVGLRRNMEKELTARDAQLVALEGQHGELSGALGEKDRLLKDVNRRQLAYTGSKFAEESADVSGNPVDNMLDGFLTPRRALDMQSGVARKKATARIGH